tara:strand:+ start:247 stop:411 length:165 start_codon:yes stop_codon:yes gene_type:complete
MKIVDVDNKIIQKIRRTNTSMQMQTLESAGWIVIDENDDKIIGAIGILVQGVYY